MNVRILLLASVITASIGQIFFKKGMSVLGSQNVVPDAAIAFRTLANILISPYILAGLVFYCTSTLLWLFALSRTELSYAYPFTALTFVLVMFASYVVFAEAMPANRIIGVVLICCGVLITSLR